MGVLLSKRCAAEPKTLDDFLGIPAGNLFAVLNNIALPAWVLLAVLPKWRTTLSLTLVPVYVYAVSYIALMLHFLAKEGLDLGAFASLDGIATAFKNDVLLLAGWLHYLAFDLLVGREIVRDAASRNVPHVLVVPCLFLTLMAGPIGWLLYQGVRRITLAC
ncbi:hypothetical protein KFE25_007980 [Diacronema lutheri]|uniref:DUF4281 domain-containing protein n=2 Tax=Diacronema lutheri TaxID=2081491 RepID=A0A8J5XDA6_DIALT|nr:hypothetical protein KFE25_007980 [Diacronema lutheri]